jgi:uncharacterized protein (TIGR00661 family)
MENKPKILYCVLNWGMGHATRSIPIIDSLRNKFEVIIASDGLALDLLKEHFPNSEFIKLPGFNIHYSSSNHQELAMAFQIPKLLKTIHKEQEIIKRITKEHKYIAILSDNRYGCYSEETPSIFIGHQLRLLVPVLESWINKKHDEWLNKFDHIWQLAPSKKYFPKFSPSENTEEKVKSLGWVSRFPESISYNTAGKIVAIISGPEPQRTIFQEKVLIWAEKSKKPILVIGGKKGEKLKKVPENIEYLDYANAEQIQVLLEGAKGIICRSGYTSIMDWSVTQTPVFFCPTPGQPEQEYLAEFFEEECGVQWMKQKDFETLIDIPFGQLPMYRCEIDFSELLTNLLEGKSEC